ncbi:MAG TPA: pyridoxal-phosphate dependent enzyme [Candidatus Dormibacteraeota bacterium]|nr:pyridoxal-phosphate dependent enzyme [Candidatus Dormibacteraeota bacterium]
MPTSAERGLQVLTAPPDRRISDCIGHTPLLRVRLFEDRAPDLLVLGKAEFLNPGGSVKDRPALRMVQEAQRSGQLGRGQVLLDSTSGNTGVAYAMLGAALGFPVKLVVPDNVGEERRQLMLAYGAELVLSDPQEGSDGAILLCREIQASDPDRYYTPDQYNNPFNWRAHYDTTGVEIWEQTEGEITFFLAGLGTSGTFVGSSRRLKEFNPSVSCISLQPEDAFHGLEGLKHMSTAIVPGIYDPSLADRNLAGPTGAAYDLARRLAREEGILTGHSSGLALWGVDQLVQEGLREGVVVLIFPDGGARYLSAGLYGAG